MELGVQPCCGEQKAVSVIFVVIYVHASQLAVKLNVKVRRQACFYQFETQEQYFVFFVCCLFFAFFISAWIKAPFEDAEGSVELTSWLYHCFSNLFPKKLFNTTCDSI